jgi:hypothetical protein
MASFAIFTSSSDDAIVVETLQAAIAMACQLIGEGRTVLRIVGTHGLIMEQADVELECARRSRLS